MVIRQCNRVRLPVGPRHGRPQVVNNQCAGHAAEISKRIFQTPDEALGRLLPDDFTVALARMRQDDPKQMRPLPFFIELIP
jgi:hypothetical protein